MHDKIKHPKHYTQGIECWDYITSHKMGYLEGNIIKYVTRYKDKDGLDDLFKAKAYLTRLIEEQFGPAIIEEPCPMKDVAPCNLDGRNCPPACSCQKADDWSEEKCAEPLDIIGNAWTPEIQHEIARAELAAHDDHMQAIANVIAAFLPAKPSDPDPYCLGDFRRGGPGAAWQTKPWINE